MLFQNAQEIDMPRKATPPKRLTLNELENETEKFHRPATEKEAAILEATIALIGERGIDGATTAAIAKRANVTERTLFRYFPSKKDLIRRVLYPMIMQRGLSKQWDTIASLLKGQTSSLKDWFVEASSFELSLISKHAPFTRTVTAELIQNDELRGMMSGLWEKHIWEPMVESLDDLKARGVLREDIDPEMLARAVHCMHIGYFLSRYVFAPNRKWDDKAELEKMGALLAYGASKEKP